MEKEESPKNQVPVVITTVSGWDPIWRQLCNLKVHVTQNFSVAGIFDWYFFVVGVTLSIVGYTPFLPPPLDINASTYVVLYIKTVSGYNQVSYRAKPPPLKHY